MTAIQVKFRDEEGAEFGGILVKTDSEKFIICGDCGGIFEVEEVEILEKYTFWVNLSEVIKGDY